MVLLLDNALDKALASLDIIMKMEETRASKFVGNWHLVAFGRCMEKTGVDPDTREVDGAGEWLLEIRLAGLQWMFTFMSPSKTYSMVYKLGKEFEADNAAGRAMKGTLHFDGDKLIEERTKIDPDDENVRIERYTEGGKLVVKMEFETGRKTKSIWQRPE